MLARNGGFLAPPVFEDQEKTRRTRLLNTVLLALIAAMIPVIVIIAVLYGLPTDPEGEFTLVAVIIVAALALILLLLTRRGHVRLASTVLLGAMWLVITVWILTTAGIKSDSSLLAYPLIIALAGLLLGGRAAIFATLLSALVVLVAYFLEATGQLVVHVEPLTIMDPVLAIVQLGLTGLLLRYAINSMVEAIHSAQENELAQIQANQELKALRDSLELRVADRTRDLERRAVQLQAATEVGRAVDLDPGCRAVDVANRRTHRREVCSLSRGYFSIGPRPRMGSVPGGGRRGEPPSGGSGLSLAGWWRLGRWFLCRPRSGPCHPGQKRRISPSGSPTIARNPL